MGDERVVFVVDRRPDEVLHARLDGGVDKLLTMTHLNLGIAVFPDYEAG